MINEVGQTFITAEGRKAVVDRIKPDGVAVGRVFVPGRGSQYASIAWNLDGTARKNPKNNLAA